MKKHSRIQMERAVAFRHGIGAAQIGVALELNPYALKSEHEAEAWEQGFSMEIERLVQS